MTEVKRATLKSYHSYEGDGMAYSKDYFERFKQEGCCELMQGQLKFFESNQPTNFTITTVVTVEKRRGTNILILRCGPRGRMVLFLEFDSKRETDEWQEALCQYTGQPFERHPVLRRVQSEIKTKRRKMRAAIRSAFPDVTDEEGADSDFDQDSVEVFQLPQPVEPDSGPDSVELPPETTPSPSSPLSLSAPPASAENLPQDSEPVLTQLAAASESSTPTPPRDQRDATPEQAATMQDDSLLRFAAPEQAVSRAEDSSLALQLDVQVSPPDQAVSLAAVSSLAPQLEQAVSLDEVSSLAPQRDQQVAAPEPGPSLPNATSLESQLDQQVAFQEQAISFAESYLVAPADQRHYILGRVPSYGSDKSESDDKYCNLPKSLSLRSRDDDISPTLEDFTANSTKREFNVEDLRSLKIKEWNDKIVVKEPLPLCHLHRGDIIVPKTAENVRMGASALTELIRTTSETTITLTVIRGVVCTMRSEELGFVINIRGSETIQADTVNAITRACTSTCCCHLNGDTVDTTLAITEINNVPVETACSDQVTEKMREALQDSRGFLTIRMVPQSLMDDIDDDDDDDNSNEQRLPPQTTDDN